VAETIVMLAVIAMCVIEDHCASRSRSVDNMCDTIVRLNYGGAVCGRVSSASP
jgi:hypothetical protein